MHTLIALISVRRLALSLLGVGLVIWVILGVLFRKPRW